ncbi:NAD(P)H-dependent oxidoreductase [Streptomyces varsoviensis]|uniref:NADPH-dependent FMN reductase n=1 Tax=Streptomyces varsoviensis TaxID=67373 RepID=UPI0033FF7758
MITAEPRRMLVLAGAAAHASRTRSVAELVCRDIAAAGGRPVLRDLAEHPLPLLHADPDGANLADVQIQAAEADAMIWVTPCYHGSYSGILKNCLDHLREDALRGKPVGVVAVGASLTAVSACDHLRAVARTLGCVTAPTQAVVSGGGLLDDGADSGAYPRIVRMIGELHALTGVTGMLRQCATADVGSPA